MILTLKGLVYVLARQGTILYGGKKQIQCVGQPVPKWLIRDATLDSKRLVRMLSGRTMSAVRLYDEQYGAA